ncbi:hypothetical protein BHM03_00010590 [Ensete ventricosum]|nr:hypothetical protein BHM03_00010590 [Ensete ventricosum]
MRDCYDRLSVSERRKKPPLPRLEGSDGRCYVGRRNCYCRPLGGSDGGAKALVVVVTIVATKEGSRADESPRKHSGGAIVGKKKGSIG